MQSIVKWNEESPSDRVPTTCKPGCAKSPSRSVTRTSAVPHIGRQCYTQSTWREGEASAGPGAMEDPVFGHALGDIPSEKKHAEIRVLRSLWLSRSFALPSRRSAVHSRCILRVVQSLRDGSSHGVTRLHCRSPSQMNGVKSAKQFQARVACLRECACRRTGHRQIRQLLERGRARLQAAPPVAETDQTSEVPSGNREASRRRAVPRPGVGKRRRSVSHASRS